MNSHDRQLEKDECRAVCELISESRGAFDIRFVEREREVQVSGERKNIDYIYRDNIGEIACEHTTVDPYDSARDAEALLKKNFPDVDLDCLKIVPSHKFKVSLFDEQIVSKGKDGEKFDWNCLQSEILHWVCDFVQKNREAVSEIVRTKIERTNVQGFDVKLMITKRETQLDGPNQLSFVRSTPPDSHSSQAERIRNSFGKLEKLANTSNGETTVLALVTVNEAIQDRAVFIHLCKQIFAEFVDLSPHFITLTERLIDGGTTSPMIIFRDNFWCDEGPSNFKE